MFSFGKILVGLGVLLVVVGLVVIGFERMGWFGRLPGDIHIERGNFSFHFPLMTSIVLSVIISIILTLIMRGR